MDGHLRSMIPIVRRESCITDESSTPEPEGPAIRTEKDIKSSLREIFAWRNYSVYLLTSWIYNAGAAVGYFFNLYLWTLYGDYVLVGFMLTVFFALGAMFRFVGGYVGDVTNRRNLSVIAMFIYSVYYLILGLSTDFLIVFVALMFLATVEVAKGGSSAYIMDNIPREHSGLALSLFTAGKSWGIITLLIFGAMIPLITFGEAYRLVYLVVSVLLFLSTVARAVFLKSGEQPEREEFDTSVLSDFVSKNWQTMKMLFKLIPGVIVIVLIDSLSDGLFKFGANIYTNEILNVNIEGINIIYLVTLIIQIPLLLKVGRISDRVGIRKAAFLVYSLMPISAILLFIAENFLYWAPLSYATAADTIYPGLGVIFTLPFIAIVMKYVNDSLWWLVIFALVHKRLPKKDTSKILAVITTSILAVQSIGPILGGFVFTIFPESFLFLIVLFLNLAILISILGTRVVQESSVADS